MVYRLTYKDNPFNCPQCKEHKHTTFAPGNKILCNTCNKQFTRNRQKEKEFLEYVEKYGYPRKYDKEDKK